MRTDHEYIENLNILAAMLDTIRNDISDEIGDNPYPSEQSALHATKGFLDNAGHYLQHALNMRKEKVEHINYLTHKNDPSQGPGEQILY